MWHSILGHDAIVELFRTALARGRLASTFLFVGPAGIGKRKFAETLAQALLCETNSEAQLEPCGSCPACQQVQAHTHPDLEIVTRPKGKSEIPLELFIGDREHRLEQGLCHKIALKPFRGGRKIAIIDDADYLNEEGANCLLKTLEEPPPRSVLILIGTSAQRQLPTIRSRSQIIRFQPLAVDELSELILAEQLAGDPAAARSLAELAGGSMSEARKLAHSELREFRQQLLATLASPGFDSVDFAKATDAFVKDAGEEASEKRERIRQLASFAADFYRSLASDLSGAPTAGDTPLSTAVAQARRRWPGNAESAVACLERCLEAEGQVDANANQATLIDCWLDDLAELSRGGR